jgi:predicted naringenin-chalcone synthase
VNHPRIPPRILGIGTANPPVRLTQEQSFHAAGYQSERIRKIFLNSYLGHRHFYLEGPLDRGESSDQLNQRYLRGAMRTGCRAILKCVQAAETTVQDVDFLAVCTLHRLRVSGCRQPSHRANGKFADPWVVRTTIRKSLSLFLD